MLYLPCSADDRAEERFHGIWCEAVSDGLRPHGLDHACLLSRILDGPSRGSLGCRDGRHECQAKVDRCQQGVEVGGSRGSRLRPTEPASPESRERPVGLPRTEPPIEVGDQRGIGTAVRLGVPGERLAAPKRG